MKKIKYLFIAFGLLFYNTSCEDFLKEEVIEKVSVDFIYNTDVGIEVGVNALYNLQRGNNYAASTTQAMEVDVFVNCGTDLGLSRTWWMPYTNGRIDPMGFPSQPWIVPYQIIDKANALIIAARNIDMDQNKKNKLVAQARLIRAELYLRLIKSYDNILLDTVATTYDNAFDPVEYKPANPIDVFNLIDADLDFAIQHLEWEPVYGRHSQGSARHIRGKSAMWQGKWDEAAEQFDAIVENGVYSLVAVDKVFAQNMNHTETIFAYLKDEATGGSDKLAGGGGTQWTGLYRARYYEIPSGEIIRTTENGGPAMGWAFPNDYLKSLYDRENDLRFETYYYPDSLFVNNPNKSNFGQPLPASSYPNNFRQYHWSLKKYHDSEKAPNTGSSYKDKIQYRFAETLLLGAEAHWRLSGENSINAKALEYINLVRERAGLPSFESFDRESYLEEHARELAFEGGFRWYLLKRMGLLVERQNLHYYYGSNSNNVRRVPMLPHMVRFPIPQSQIELMETFPQNPDY